MGKVRWEPSKKYVGVYWIKSKGSKSERIFYITYKRGRRKVWEKVGKEADGYTQKFAADLRSLRVKQIRHGDELPADRAEVPRLDALAQRFLEWSQINRRSYADDERRWRLHLEPYLGARFIDEILPLDLERLKRDLSKKGLAPQTITHVLALFRAIWNKGLDWGLLALPNPCRKVKPPQVNNTRERALTAAEVDQLLGTMERSPSSYGFTVLGYHTGARKSEIFALCWADIDLDGRNVVFRRTKHRTRRVPLSKTAVSYLRTIGPGDPGAPVITNHAGIAVTRLSNTWQRKADALFNQGISDPRLRVVPHTLRHSFVSRLVAAGKSLRTVMALTGHTSLRTLQRYAHLAPDATRQAIEIFDEKTSKIEIDTFLADFSS